MFHNPQAEMARTMVREQLQRRGVTDARVLQAMVNVPRHQFMSTLAGTQQTSTGDPNVAAYADYPSPIGQGQTISQPFIVAFMTQWLNVQPGSRVLEIGTGSGYQAAVLMELGARVYTIERSEILATRADKLMHLLIPEAATRETSFQIKVGDGSLGWPEHGPYDRIIVTAGAPHLPGAYAKQLAKNGRIVIPIGNREEQHLMLFDERDGKLIEQKTLACRFVPLTGADGWEPISTPDAVSHSDQNLSHRPPAPPSTPSSPSTDKPA